MRREYSVSKVGVVMD